MKDNCGREINYLRISVTDRCNLRCRYCMPEKGAKQISYEDFLTFEEITEVAKAAADIGVIKIRVTGGEPLLRESVHELVRILAGISGITDLAMSTNGILLAQHAQVLADAGLHRVNVSLDTLDMEKYRDITRGGDLGRVLQGIEAARKAGLKPIKLNCVVEKSSSETDARQVAAYARENGCEVRFIRAMDIARGTFSVVEGGSGGDCPRCNRLRLSADGMIRPCLLSDVAFSVKTLGPKEAIRKAVQQKPRMGGPCSMESIGSIGG